MEIKVTNVAKEFGTTAALEGVSLDVHSGELLALLGPSGSGKTTLLRVIAGLEQASQGQVFFGGEDATNLSVQRRRVGFVFQHYALFKHMNVADNIAYGLRARPRAHRPSEQEIRRRIGEFLELVQLSGYERRFPTQLSGGQQQRVALARALAVEPRVLLLDEPFGALDAKVRKDLRSWLRDIHRRTEQTTIFVTHDQDEALELADRVAILNEGRLEQIGTVDDVQDRPASPFVVKFVGDTVQLDAEISDGHVRLANRNSLPLQLPEGVSGQVTVYARPWHVACADKTAAHLSGIIIGMRRLADARRLDIICASQERLEVDLPLDASAKVGDAVHLKIEKGFIFPK